MLRNQETFPCMQLCENDGFSVVLILVSLDVDGQKHRGCKLCSPNRGIPELLLWVWGLRKQLQEVSISFGSCVGSPSVRQGKLWRGQRIRGVAWETRHLTSFISYLLPCWSFVAVFIVWALSSCRHSSVSTSCLRIQWSQLPKVPLYISRHVARSPIFHCRVQNCEELRDWRHQWKIVRKNEDSLWDLHVSSFFATHLTSLLDATQYLHIEHGRAAQFGSACQKESCIFCTSGTLGRWHPAGSLSSSPTHAILTLVLHAKKTGQECAQSG